MAAAWSIGVLRPAGITAAARRLLSDADLGVRQGALWMLLRSGDPEARAAIRAARRDASDRIRLLAARADSGQWTAWNWTMPAPRPRPVP